MGQKEMAVTAAGENRIMIFGPKTDGAYVIELIHRVVTGAPVTERLRCGGYIDYGSSSSGDYGGVGHAGLD